MDLIFLGHILTVISPFGIRADIWTQVGACASDVRNRVRDRSPVDL